MNTQKILGLEFSSWLTLLFITLKLCKVIAWSWWWVLAPLWIPLIPVAIALTIAGVTFIVGGLLLLIAWILELCRK